jgi:tetratricopeptide (TPR) repeat protein
MNICEAIGDRVGITYAIGNMGNAYFERGEYDRAIALQERKLSICQELGDLRGISMAIGNMGNVYSSRGEHDRAIECYDEQIRISSELGDRRSIYYAIGNLGGTYASRGEYDRAIEQLHHAAEEHRAIGDRPALSEWRRAIADVLVELCATAEEMPEYAPTYVPGLENPPDPAGQSTTLDGQWRVMCLRYARECAEESIAICDELSIPDILFNARVLLARIDAAEGRRDVASQRLRTMLEDASNDAQRADLHYQLWKLGESNHAVPSLALYQSLYAATPNHEYHKRIEELRAAGESS